MSFHGMTPKTSRHKRQSRALLERRMERALRKGRGEQEKPETAAKTASSRPDEEAGRRERPSATGEERQESVAETEVDRILAAARKAGVMDPKDEDPATAAPKPPPTDRPGTSERDEGAVDREVEKIRQAGEKVGVEFK